MEAIPTAPRWPTERCPIKIVSTDERRGIEILLSMLGIASLSISLFMAIVPAISVISNYPLKILSFNIIFIFNMFFVMKQLWILRKK